MRMKKDIENGIYSVEIPQEFLDKAVYPIKSNDDFGYASIGSSHQSTGYRRNTTSMVRRTGYNISSGGVGTMDSLTAYLKRSSGYTDDITTTIFIKRRK